MQTAQINLKVDPQLKKKSQAVAQKLGFNLSNVLRAFLVNFTNKQEINFSLKKEPKRVSQKKFIQEMIDAGYEKKYAKEVGCDYGNFLKAEKEGTLTQW